MIKYFGFALLLTALTIQTVSAHQPEIVGSKTGIEISEPEISKAYYGQLNGQAIEYTIKSSKPFNLYVNLLTPASDNNQTLLSAKITDQNNRIISTLDGKAFVWQPYYEPFGGDNYYKGPEYRTHLSGGEYGIEVTSQNNFGPYVVAVGETESFTLDEMISAIKILPELKLEYFGEPWWRIFTNPFYAGIIIVIIIVVIIIYFLIRHKVIHHRVKKFTKPIE